MKDKETIAEMFTRFTDITNSLIALGKKYSQVEMVRKLLRALTSDWEKKTTAIEEANDISKLTVEDLIGNLMAYEVQLEDRKKDDEPKNKSLAFKASENEEDTDSDEEDEIALFTRKFRKYLKKGKFKNSSFKNSNESSMCFNCNKPGHFKKDCPLLRQRFNPSTNDSKKFNKFKKKALAATWDDSNSSSSDEEEIEENQKAYMCFMAQDNEVSENSELLDAFNELYEKFKRLKVSHRFLKSENERLNFELVTSHSSQVEDLTELKDKLLIENDSLTNENVFLKNECKCLNVRISDLDSSISSLKSKYDSMLLNVSKFNKGKENLNSLLSFQKPSNNRLGIGFVKAKSHSHAFHASKNVNHAYMYSNISRNKHINTDRSFNLNVCSSVKNRLPTSTPSMFIWVPKHASVHDRNKYILDFRQNICNSDKYVYINKGKPNSKWIWTPKG